jgi:NADPH2:quinone reductase
MRAVVCRAFGDPGSVSVEEVRDPPVGGSDLRIAVRASGLSFANLLALAGSHQNRAELPFTPGTDVSGVVIECGPDVTLFAPGDRVAVAVRRGGFAEQVVAPQRTVFALPPQVDHDAAVQFPVMYGTAYAGLRWRARLEPGETVLVHGGAGGSGMAAIEVAKCLGARVIATAGTPEKAEACRRHGADEVVEHRERSVRGAALTLTSGRGVDVVFDPVGGDAFAESLRCIAPDGRLVCVGFASGTIPNLPANIPLVKNFDVIGLYWGHYLGWGRIPSHPREEGRVRAAMAQLFDWHATGRLTPEVHARFPLDDFRAALAAVASRAAIGRVVLNP